MTLEQLITSIGSVVTALVGWSTTLLGFITSNPIILLPCILGFVGVVVITVRSFLR